MVFKSFTLFINTSNDISMISAADQTICTKKNMRHYVVDIKRVLNDIWHTSNRTLFSAWSFLLLSNLKDQDL